MEKCRCNMGRGLCTWFQGCDRPQIHRESGCCILLESSIIMLFLLQAVFLDVLCLTFVFHFVTNCDRLTPWMLGWTQRNWRGLLYPMVTQLLLGLSHHHLKIMGWYTLSSHHCVKMGKNQEYLLMFSIILTVFKILVLTARIGGKGPYG